ncbi:MAG: Molybdenum cofactor guanylyltransferase [Candidatus Tokpelaia hoelldobleri]|uniref:Molybdenum cofactor guanylyltransferase n=1 Tax=Candidatus Tokpelaia hoelldobleri TaxID=1902579 RepID=A0A1U9JV74_9HYPH|nr:MAG: Molybdenum cofactor guanylyltransferase [Candidatus Tokpelaia hoelldoblerii]
MRHDNVMKVLGVVLAGGQSSRMGEDKALLRLDGETLLEHAVRRLQGQLASYGRNVVLSAPVRPAYDRAHVPVIADHADFCEAGPLAGIFSAMLYGRDHGFEVLATVAVDTPFFPPDYVARMLDGYMPEQLVPVIAASKNRLHPAFAIWPVGLAEDLYEVLHKPGKKSIQAFAQSRQAKHRPFTSVLFDGDDPFFNINTQDDFARAQEIYQKNREHSL